MKRKVLPTTLLCLAVVAVVALAATPAGAAPSFDQAVDRLVADGYTVGIEDDLTSLGTDPFLGFRMGGSWAEHEASYYVRDELIDVGLSDVHLEPVPLDGWDFKGAWVKVGKRTIVASSFAGVPGTDGIVKSELVYVGMGTRYDFDAAGDVTGKLVLVDAEFDDWWVNFVGSEATLRGAAGVVMTYGESTFPWYAIPDALGSNDGEYDDEWIPMVYVAWQDGDWLKAQLAAGPVQASMRNDVEITLAEDGGVGYNVIGLLQGRDREAAPLLVSSHVDAYFRNGFDDTGAVANELLMAKAMMMSGYRPARTIIFFFTCAEEYGYTDCWYDWAIGAWYAITREHPEWPGKLALMLNIENMAQTGCGLAAGGWVEIVPYLETVAAQSGDVLPYGFGASPAPDTWSDPWSWAACGVPTVMTSASDAGAGSPLYHTSLLTKELVDHDYLGDIAKFHYRLLAGMDTGLLPYDFAARGDLVLWGIQKTGNWIRGGVGKRWADRFQAAATEFRNAAWRWEQRKDATPAGEVDAVNERLIALDKVLNQTFTSRDQFDFVAFPHWAPVQDATYLAKAISAAKAGDAAKAQEMLWSVGVNWYAAVFSPEVCRQDLTRRDPGYEHVTWGTLGTPPLVVDCIDEYGRLERGDFPGAIAGLEEDLAMVQADLRAKVAHMTTVLEELTKEVNALP